MLLVDQTKKDIRVVGGYDPVKEEYLITLLRPTTLDTVASEEPDLIYGCTDPGSLNFNPTATFNNGTCLETADDTPCAEGDLGSISEGDVSVSRSLRRV